MAPKKKPRKMRKSVTRNRNMVLYVEDSIMKGRVFKDAKSATRFVNQFKKTNPNPDDGYWVDLLVTDIKGEIKSLDQMDICEQA